jgi:regulation of enolase protein 1 (concanavalin A-like superfamily)
MENTTRRTFLTRTIAAGTAALCRAAGAESVAESQASGKALLDRMVWLNQPASAKQSGDQLVVVSRPKTDFWRKTFYGYVTDNGHFLNLPVAGNFTFQSRVAGRYSALYDQAGLMVRVDASNWLKCGIELVNNIGHASVVITRDYSDWSTVRGITIEDPIWWRVARKGSSLESFFSLDGKTYTSIRLGYLELPETVNVGVMCAAPEGVGFECRFDEIRLSKPA